MADGTCAGCCDPKKPIAARGFCNACYRRHRRAGAISVRPYTRHLPVEEWLDTVNLDTDECVLWPGRVDPHGYGLTSRDGGQRRVHRVIYELLIGPLDPTMTLDHECHNQDLACPAGVCDHRRCQNVFRHIVQRTPGENVLRSRGPGAVNAAKAVCLHGHPLWGDNLYVYPSGKRACRACNNASHARRKRSGRRVEPNPVDLILRGSHASPEEVIELDF